jgi:hypothetical protein
MRGALSLTSYLLFTGFLALLLCLIPYQALVLAFAPSGYTRVVQQAEAMAAAAAQRAPMAAAIGEAAAASSAASVAARIVAGPAGWAALGVMAGLAIMQAYYSQQDIQNLQKAAATAASQSGGTYTDPATGQSYPVPPGSSSKAKNADCPGGSMYYFPPPAPPGLGGTGITDWYCLPSPITAPAAPSTPQQYAGYVGGLPPSDPNALDQHTAGVGAGASPSAAQSVTAIPVSPTEVPTVVKPTDQVLPSDIVVNPNAPPPAGTPQTTNKNQDITTTSRITTNPDGSTTKQDTDQATVTCAASGKGEATFASVLAAHQATWSSSGLLGTLNGLKNIVWVDTLPVVTLPSTYFGNQTLDFTQWAWAFAAIKAITIARASFAAYRIVFG